ncbi:MAG: hypothetical protein R2725_03820 [Solirubrobacterales bacterium]
MLSGAVVVAACLLLLVPAAFGIRLKVGDLIVVTDGGVTPTKLPKHRFAPIAIEGHGRISTAGGGLPPALKRIVLYFDKHGEVETRGLPVCPRRRLEATTTAQARKACRGAIVGKGFGKGVVKFEDQPAIPASSPITIFNGPKKHGNPTVLAHVYLEVPAPTAYIVPIEIERVTKGRYGFKTVAEIPEIAGGAGIPQYGRIVIGRRWRHKGKRLSFANAACPDGRLQAKGEFAFDDGNVLHGTFLQRCHGTGR